MTRRILAKVYSGALTKAWRTMTALSAAARLAAAARWRGYIHQLLMVALINVPTVSFGLAMGWVSLASGESGAGAGGTGESGASAGGEGAGGELVAAAATTFAASLVGVPLSARAIAAGRKFAVLATSAAFVVCWSLKLCGEGWWLVAARAAAGLGGAGAWSVAPLLAKEMCERGIGGAAVAALVLAHNLGFLLMYLAADAQVPHTTVLWCCLGLSAGHFVVFLFVPESPAYLAANGKLKEAASSLAWLRGRRRDDPALTAELKALPAPDDSISSPLQLAKDLLSDRRRRRAFIISAIAVVGQEMCGVFALLQFAERVFVLARDEQATPASETSGLSGVSGMSPHGPTELMSPARLAVLLGVVQLVASAVALYLVERVGRRPLIVVCAYATGASLACGAVAAWLRAGGAPAGWALAAAVAADSAGLQPAPYALLADCFHYQYRGCALMLVMAATCIGNAVEVFIFPVVATSGGITSALALASLLTLAYAVFATVAVPETRGRTPEQIYDQICPPKERDHSKEQTCPRKVKNQVDSDCVVTVQSNSETEYTTPRMGLLDKLSVWLGRGRAEVTVLVLGLDNSGKSTLLNALRPPEQRVPHVTPTVAQQQDHFQSGGVSFSAWDVSGAARHRALWERHYRHTHALIFVVDAADHLRLVVAREELELATAHPDLAGRRIPLLVFANKCDAPHALAPAQVAAGEHNTPLLGTGLLSSSGSLSNLWKFREVD